MRLVVGLGNPGSEYQYTRHNLGFLTIDAFFDRIGKQKARKVANAFVVEVGDRWFAKPLTFMNESGKSVPKLAERASASPDETLIIHDDADLEPGQIKLKKGGGAGGHNGLASIFAEWQTQEFWRLRIGIGKNPNQELAVFVLEPISFKKLKPVAEAAADALEKIFEFGPEKAMNAINARVNNTE
jgi:peptidyl-tRNA hydrolase, PTH1 family